MKYTYTYKDQNFSVELASGRDTSGKIFQASLDGNPVDVELIGVNDNRINFRVGGAAATAFVSRDGPKRWITINGHTYPLTKTVPARLNTSDAPLKELIRSQLPGLIRMVAVKKGESVKAGQTLAVIEAMKMENKVTAPFDGKVKKISIEVGQAVERGKELMEIEPQAQK